MNETCGKGRSARCAAANKKKKTLWTNGRSVYKMKNTSAFGIVPFGKSRWTEALNGFRNVGAYQNKRCDFENYANSWELFYLLYNINLVNSWLIELTKNA